MRAVVVAEGVAILLLGVLVLGLLRSHAQILRALHDLGAGLALEDQPGAASPAGPVPVTLERGVVPATRPEGTAAQPVVGTDLTGGAVVVDVLARPSRTLLAFLSSGCSVCQGFWEEFAAGQVDVPGGARLVVVVKGAEEESPAQLRRLAGASPAPGAAGALVPVVQSSAAWADYAVPGSPYFVYVLDGSVVGEGSSTTWGQVRDLMGQAVGDADAPVAGAGIRVVDGGRDDLARADRELLAAGIYPGHASTYQRPDPALAPEQEPRR